MHGVGVKSTPIHTGILRKWFRERQSWLKWKMFNKVKYAKFVNEWTRFQKANPFLKNIRNLSENKIDTILNNEIEKVIW